MIIRKKQNPGLSLAENIVVEQYKIKVFLLNYLLILKILSVTIFSDPTTTIFGPEIANSRKPLKSSESPPGPLNFGAFSLQPMRGRRKRILTNHNKGNSIYCT
jgi:hypothetical protein